MIADEKQLQKIENMRLADENAERVDKQAQLIEQMMALLELNNIDYSHLMFDEEDETSARRQKLDNDTNI